MCVRAILSDIIWAAELCTLVAHSSPTCSFEVPHGHHCSKESHTVLFVHATATSCCKGLVAAAFAVRSNQLTQQWAGLHTGATRTPVPPFHVLLLFGSLQCFRQVCMCVCALAQKVLRCAACVIYAPSFSFGADRPLYIELLSTGAATY